METEPISGNDKHSQALQGVGICTSQPRDPGLATKVRELEKWTSQLEQMLYESHQRLFGMNQSEPRKEDHTSESINDTVRNCCMRLASLCGFVSTMNGLME